MRSATVRRRQDRSNSSREKAASRGSKTALAGSGRGGEIAGRGGRVKNDHWNLKDLLENPQRDFTALTKDLDTQVGQFEGLRNALSPGLAADTFLNILRLAEAITRTMNRLGAYAYLWFSENTKHQPARAFKAKV